ncbi:MAG: undecaprenyl-diphosphate phosphatase [Geobacter sp.]|nr:undecaprenyl-diphosphate phosphatase [Geobacter sp.]
MNILDALLLGIVEGLSEFLPISSTGHLILASALLKINQTEAHKAFEVTIQSGAILAVVWLYRQQLAARSDLLLKLCVGFIPTGVLGFLFYKTVKSFFLPSTVSYSLIVGGIVFIIIERYLKSRPEPDSNLEGISYRTAFAIGLIQSLSMVPGVSRSGATIMGGLMLGMNRKDAAEFSFLLAIPTLLAATVYDVYKNFSTFSLGEGQTILVGFITSFVFAIIGIKALLKFITSHTFIPFGIYRIVAGILFLLFLP